MVSRVGHSPVERKEWIFGILRYSVVHKHSFTNKFLEKRKQKSANPLSLLSAENICCILLLLRKLLAHILEPVSLANPPGENVLSVLFKRLAVVQDDVRESSVCDPGRNSFSLAPLETSLRFQRVHVIVARRDPCSCGTCTCRTGNPPGD